MRLLVLLNHRGGLKPEQSSTALVLTAAERHGHAWIAGINNISLDGDAVVFDAARVERGATTGSLRGAGKTDVVSVEAKDLDAILIRTNPGRDQARSALHDAGLNLCRLAQQQGVLVLNDPDALPRASDKLFLGYLPESLRPRMLVSRDAARLRAFVEDGKGSKVLKPLFGTQGRGVFKVTPQGPNLSALIEVLSGDGYVIAQEYLRRAPEGDTRVVTVDGQTLTVDGKHCAVRRVPRGGEFRSNVHLGGRATRAEPTQPLLRAANAIGEILAEHGIWMAGVDLVGTKAVEVNVRSPGGIVDASEFEGVDFQSAVIESIERRVGA